MKYLLVFLICFLLGLILNSCGNEVTSGEPITEVSNEERILALEGQLSQISGLIESDFKSCPASGDTADALIRKMCQVAQAATVEAQVEFKAQLATFVKQMEDKISALNAQGGRNEDEITALQTAITSLDGRMTSAEAAITALQNSIASINGTLSGTMNAVEVGTEILSAGPLYETLLRRGDKARINGYVESYGTTQSLPNGPLTASNGNSSVTVSLTAHGYSTNDVVELGGLVEGRGFSSGHLVGEFLITGTTANTFTVTLGTTATSNGSFGGNMATVRKVLGRGIGTLWKTVDGADVAVRQTKLGSKRYNFIVKSNGDICYDTTNPLANFATINAGGVNILCK